MKICMYTGTALPKIGGQELVIDALARQFVKFGHEVVLLAPRPRLPMRPADSLLPYRVERHPRFYSTRHLVEWYKPWLTRLVRRFKPDVLHCHDIYPSGYLAALCRREDLPPRVITSHGGDVAEKSIRLNKPGMPARYARAVISADALIAISAFTEAGLRRLTPGDDLKTIVPIPNGVDLERFAEKVERPQDLDLAIEPGKYFLFLGRLKRRKGVDVLLDALALIPADGSVQLVIAGDGDERAALERQARALGLTDRVRFVGLVEGARKVYLLQNCLSAVMPTRVWEAFGLVVLESYASGRPIIGSALPGLGDLIINGKTGYQVPPENAAELAAAMSRMLADPAHAALLAANAREAAGRFSWESVARQHIQLYQKLAQDRPAPQRL